MKDSAGIRRGFWVIAAVFVAVVLVAGLVGCGTSAPPDESSQISSQTFQTVTSGTDAGLTDAGLSEASTTTEKTNPWTARKATSSTTPGSGTAQAPSGSTASSQPSGASSTDTASTGGGSTTSQATTTSTQSSPTTQKSTTTTQKPTTTTTAGPVVLQVKGPSGTKSYTMAQLKAKPSASGYWGPHKGDFPYPTDRYKGVPLFTLLNEVGGLPSGASIKINTTDNFPCTYDPARLAQVANGTYQVWDKVTAQESTASVQLIVAYEMNGSPLDSSVGPLRLVPAVSTDIWVTEGKFSPYWVISIEVL
jgi:hypothetical protein